MQQIDDLLAGFDRYRTKYSGRGVSDELKVRQQPRFLIVACSDSRTDPAILFDAAPGDLFVVRNVANLVPPYQIDYALHGVSATLEFGVTVLNVTHVVVLGHSECAGIRALVTGAEGEFIGRWMKIAEAARQRTAASLPGASEKERCGACEQAAIVESMENLRSFPWIHERVTHGTLFLHGWYFDIQSETLSRHEPRSDQFIVIPKHESS